MEDKNVKEMVIKNFSKNASSYVTSTSHAMGKDLPKIVEWLEPLHSWKVLDIATGGGHVAKALSPYVNQVFATDLTRKMLENTSKHLEDYDNIFYCIADAEELPFLDETFDAVTCRIAPHHFPNPDKFIREVSRVLKPNGKLILIDNIVPKTKELANYMNTFERLRDSSHARCLSLEEWKSLFAQYKLEVVKENTRKKKYVFDGWVKRTTDTEEQIERVKNYILKGTQEQRQYFNVLTENDEILSMEIDEAMILCVK